MTRLLKAAIDSKKIIKENFIPTISKKQFEDYKKLCYDRDHGRLLTLDGLRFICEANSYEPEAIGEHFLEVLAKLQPTYK